ncbi:porin [Rhodocyclus purpureus]|uniref:porin n=1 Tax=Rhodocyclus purpureus TaxID=1067 RepID=UPI001913471C|nr:porin [Rhodocyclus purpureus]
MQKKLIALAVAGLVSGGAFAQSNVSIYGIVDMGYMNKNFDGADKTVNGIDSGILSVSRLGFKGEEALGNGLKAIFNLEYALAIDNNAAIGTDSNGNMKARQQYVGLSSDAYGKVFAGYLQSAGWEFATGVSPLSGSALGAHPNLAFNGATQLSASGRLENAIAYVSPTFAGFTVALNHGRITEQANTTSVADAYANQIGISYANGPITAGYVYSKQSYDQQAFDAAKFGNAAAPGFALGDIVEHGIRGGYDFGVAKLQAAYQTFEYKDLNSDRDSKWVVGATVPVTAAGKIIGEYASLNVKNPYPAGVQNINGYTPNLAAYADAKAWTLAYTHDLSKRTTAYVGYNQVSSDVVNTSSTGDVKRFAFGVRHAF